jgi:amino acid transporter
MLSLILYSTGFLLVIYLLHKENLKNDNYDNIMPLPIMIAVASGSWLTILIIIIFVINNKYERHVTNIIKKKRDEQET